MKGQNILKILFTVCARAGSKGVKNKNLKYFLNFRLPYYSFSVIDLFVKLNPNHECDIALNTDINELIELVNNELKIKVNTIKRSKNLSGDFVSKVRVIQDSYKIMCERLNKTYDMIVDLDITSPLRTLNDLQHIVGRKETTNVEVIYSVTESRRNPYFNIVMKTKHGFKRVIDSSFSSRQETPKTYDMNASLYAYSPEFLASNKEIFEATCDIIEMIDTAVLDIDSESDFELMEVVAKHFYNMNAEMKAVRDNILKILRK